MFVNPCTVLHCPAERVGEAHSSLLLPRMRRTAIAAKASKPPSTEKMALILCSDAVRGYVYFGDVGAQTGERHDTGTEKVQRRQQLG